MNQRMWLLGFLPIPLSRLRPLSLSWPTTAEFGGISLKVQCHLSQLDSVCKVPFQNLIYTFGKIMKIWLLDHIMKGSLSPVGQHTFAFPFWVEQLLPVPLHPLRWARVQDHGLQRAWKCISPCLCLLAQHWSLVYFSVNQKQRDEHDGVLDRGRLWTVLLFIFVHVWVTHLVPCVSDWP